MRRFVALVGVSALLHALLAVWLIERWTERQSHRLSGEAIALHLDLQDSTTPVSPVEPEQKPTPSSVTAERQTLAPTASTQPPVETMAAPDTAPAPLDLDRHWLRESLQAAPLPRRLSEQQSLLRSFRPEAEQRLASAQRRRDDRRLLAERARERDGVAPEDYQSQNQLGDVVKTDKGCFAAQRTPGLNGMETRWWRTGCGEPRKSVWEQSVLSFDGNGSSVP